MGNLSSQRSPQLSGSVPDTELTSSTISTEWSVSPPQVHSSFLTHLFCPAHVVFPLQLFYAFAVQLSENSKTNGLVSSALTLAD